MKAIHRLYVSGGLSRAEMILQTLSDELGLPCEIWDPLENCEVALPAAKRKRFQQEFVSLNVACGAAFEYLRINGHGAAFKPSARRNPRSSGSDSAIRSS